MKFIASPVFGSGFSEGSTDQISPDPGSASRLDTDMADDMNFNAPEGLSLPLVRQYEDSDDEDDDYEDEDPNEIMILDEGSRSGMRQIPSMSVDISPTVIEGTRPPSTETASSEVMSSWTTVMSTTDDPADPEDDVRLQRNVRAKFSHPSTPRARDLEMEPEDVQSRPSNPRSQSNHSVQIAAATSDVLPPPTSSRKVQVVVRDVAYATYRAVLYYVSTSITSYRLRT